MSNTIISSLETIGSGAATAFRFVTHVLEVAVQDEKIIEKLTPEAKKIMVKIFADIASLVADGTITVAEKGTNIMVDAKVISDIQQLYMDAKNDVPAVKAMFDALSIKIA